jgi:raffinose/stachyose/melibiose transport system permease protein
MNRNKAVIFTVVACLPAAILFLVFYLIPVTSVLLTSFLKWDRVLVEGFAGLDNYKRLFGDPIILTSIKNSLSWMLVATFVHIPLAVITALILSTKFRGWKVLRTAYFLPQIISGTVWAVIYIAVFNPEFGLINGVLKMIGLENMQRNWLFDSSTAWPSILGTWLFLIGMFNLIIVAEILSIPGDIFESAEIDGANKIQQALYLKIPLLRNIIGTCLILTISGGLRYFEGLYIMTNGAPNYRTETLSLYLFQQYRLAHFAYANAIGILLIAFGAVLILIVTKVFRMKNEIVYL